MKRSGVHTAVVVLAVASLLGCSAEEDPSGSSDATSEASASAGDSTEPPASAEVTEVAGPPPAEGPADLSRWFDADFSGGDLALGEVRERTEAYTSYDATYRSESLTVTGVLNVPTGDGPFPALVLAHGYVDPEVYESGQGMTRERAALALAGYIAFHIDYRNHAGSDDDPALFETHRFGYAVDVINAVTALRDAPDLQVDDERVGVFGRSMGGGAVLEALEMAPGHVDAAILYSAVSSDAADNQRQFSDGAGFWDQLAERTGGPDVDPAYYEAASTRTYIDRVSDPVLMVHGRDDEECPPPWAQDTYDALETAGADVALEWFDDQHAFGPEFDASIAAIEAFLDDKWN